MNARQQAEERAAQKVMAVRPACVGVRRLAQVLADTEQRVFHAGPPYRSAQEIPAPVLHSAAQAAVFEGWCADLPSAMQALRAGKIATASAQEHRLLVPLAGVLSASMAVMQVADPSQPAPIWTAINEGQTHATRLGRLDDGLLAHLRWLNGPFADWLGTCFEQALDLLPLLAESCARGDDGHARTVEGSRLVVDELLRRQPAAEQAVRDFLAACPAFALNLWMAAAALAARAAEGDASASLVTRAGGNGVEFGIQLASRPDHWIRMPAPIPQGRVEAPHQDCQAVGALGDSAVVDFAGLGGQALPQAPMVAQGLAGVLPNAAEQRAGQVLAASEWRAGQGLCATSASACVAAGVGPLVLIGMIDAQGRAGRIGGGVVDMSVDLFRQALNAQE